MVDGEVIGDPLDVKMFGFTKWTLEEGRVAATGNIKSKGTVIEQTALVQTVVRPPGSVQFRLEDALKGSSKVGSFLVYHEEQLRDGEIACTLFGTRRYPNL